MITYLVTIHQAQASLLMSVTASVFSGTEAKTTTTTTAMADDVWTNVEEVRVFILCDSPPLPPPVLSTFVLRPFYSGTLGAPPSSLCIPYQPVDGDSSVILCTYAYIIPGLSFNVRGCPFIAFGAPFKRPHPAH